MNTNSSSYNDTTYNNAVTNIVSTRDLKVLSKITYKNIFEVEAVCDL